MSLQQAVFTAAYNHLCENARPHILVDTQLIPENFLTPYAGADGTVVLNISPRAVPIFVFNTAGINISISIKGERIDISIPYTAIYAMFDSFNPNNIIDFRRAFPRAVVNNEPAPTEPTTPVKKKPTLTLVK